MNSKTDAPIDSDRRQKLRDALTLFPFVGFLFVMLPVLSTELRNSSAIIYYFLLWIVLISGTAWLSRLVRRLNPAKRDQGIGQ